ncbi:MAG TPA: LytS/YhcK type 5TM receptor domain-containing protein [Methylomirabilota bacterium]|nr:LytS/YhcK type 5TM receptor domain-containing protein [Methylomirabilota bacterium]
MEYHDLLEAVGIVVSGVLFYSYTYSWFPPGHPERQRWWTAVLGLSFGLLSILMMLTRIQIGRDLYMDARLVPVALIGLFEGWRIGLLAGLVGAAYRLWLGGAGTGSEMIGLGLMGVGAGLVHRWAGGAERVGQRHAIVVTAIAFALTALQSAVQGPGATHAFSLVRIPYLVMLVAGIAFLARLFSDVVEQNRLMRERQRFRAILDEASDGIRIMDADTLTILDCNRADCEMSGRTREELIGRNGREFWPDDPESRSRREAAMAEARATGIARLPAVPYRTASGQTLLVDSTRRVVEYQRRRYEIIIYRDAGERLKAEAALREAGELRSVNLLAQAAAHEINNPLAVIAGYLQLLGDRAQQGSQEAKWLGMSIEAAGRIKDAVARLRRIVRIESTQPAGSTPAILDTEKSSRPADE